MSRHSNSASSVTQVATRSVFPDSQSAASMAERRDPVLTSASKLHLSHYLELQSIAYNLDREAQSDLDCISLPAEVLAGIAVQIHRMAKASMDAHQACERSLSGYHNDF